MDYRKLLTAASLPILLLCSVVSNADQWRNPPIIETPGITLPPMKPDLVINELALRGGKAKQQGYVRQRIRIVVKNIGTRSAGRFKVVVRYGATGPRGARGGYAGIRPYLIAHPGSEPVTKRFSRAPSPPKSTSVFSLRPTASNQYVLIEGWVFMPSSHVLNETVILRAIVDSCHEDEFQPAHCRVDELNENNNSRYIAENYLDL